MRCVEVGGSVDSLPSIVTPVAARARKEVLADESFRHWSTSLRVAVS
jgi:hypothetical protein